MKEECTFTKWAEESTSTTQYESGTSYNKFTPEVNTTAVTQNMYAMCKR